MRLFFARLAVITAIIGPAWFVTGGHAKSMTAPFSGTWTKCERHMGSDICSYQVLAQTEDRLCGLWGYWASGQLYQGRLTAFVTGPVAKVDQICGRPGSDTSKNCTYEADGREAWEPSTQSLFLCKDKLYMSKKYLPGLCHRSAAAAGLKPGKNSSALLVIDAVDREWLETCVRKISK